jgi:hypothetical protein
VAGKGMGRRKMRKSERIFLISWLHLRLSEQSVSLQKWRASLSLFYGGGRGVILGSELSLMLAKAVDLPLESLHQF